MKKVYNSSGVEVKIAKLGPIGIGYICPTCGQPHCCREHCLRCGQPIVFDESELLRYKEHYKNVDEECAIIDKEILENNYVDTFTGEPLPLFSDIRKELIKNWKQ